MIPKANDAITKADIDSLVTNAVPESKTLEFKEALPSGSDADKREFLADISSFANASGGDLIFGVREAGGIPQAIPSLDVIDADAEIGRLENILRTGISLRIPGTFIKAITGFQNGPVIIVRIPRSWSGPHMVILGGTSKFFTRNSAGKHQMDIGEIRSAFALSESLPERIRQFRADRLGRIIADETPVPLSSPQRLVLHIVPLPSFLSNQRLDLFDMNKLVSYFAPIHGNSCDLRFNLDGFLMWEGEFFKGHGHGGYCQLFRDGVLEAVTADVLRNGPEKQTRGGRDTFDNNGWEFYIVSALRRYLDGYKILNQTPPMVISLALLGCKGAYLLHHGRHPIDRDLAIFPDVLMEDAGADIPTVMRPIFDAVSNAGGSPRSFTYNEKGEWKP